MAGTHGKNLELFMGGYDFTPFVTSVSMSGEREIAQDTNPTDDSHRYKGGFSSGSMSASGRFSDGTDEAVRIVKPLLGVQSSTMMFMPAGSAVGNDMLGMQATAVQMDINSPLDDLVELSIEAQSTVGLDVGRVLHALTSETGAVSGTAIDNGAATANGGALYLTVTSFTGTDLAIAVQDSADGSTGWADILVADYDGSQAVEYEERKQLAEGSAVRQYTRVNVTTSGGFSECTFALGFARYAD